MFSPTRPDLHLWCHCSKCVCYCVCFHPLGQTCSINIDDCDPDPCDATGTEECVDLVEDFMCDCKPGYMGKNCSVSSQQTTVYHISRGICSVSPVPMCVCTMHTNHWKVGASVIIMLLIWDIVLKHFTNKFLVDNDWYIKFVTEVCVMRLFSDMFSWLTDSTDIFS